MIVDYAIYRDGKRAAEPRELTRLDAACRGGGGIAWVGLYRPTEDEFDAVRREFGLHELAVEDAVHAHQRPKIELFDGSLFVVLKTARYIDRDELVEIGEVMAFVGPRFVVTVRHGEASPLHEVRLDLEAHPDLLGIGPSSVLYAIADRVVDDYAIVIEGLAVDIEAVSYTHLTLPTILLV